MLLDIKKIFGTYDEPVTAALELDLSEEDFPGYTVPGTVEARITATLQGRMLEIALDITADVAFACARCLEERTRALPCHKDILRARGGSERPGCGA